MTAGSDVTLTAAPAPGSVFTGWSGGCAGTGACVVTMSQAQNVTATFAPQPPAEPGPAQAQAPASAPAASAQVPTPQIQVAGIVVFPSAKACRRSRALTLRLRAPRGVKATSARVVVTGRKTTTLRGSALTKPVKVRLLRGRNVRVQVTITLADGRTVRDSRTYRVCRASRR
jgi:hypothetical protein